MKVILLKDVKNVGRSGELINVSDGYATNLLFPKKLGVQATPQELAKYEKHLEKEAGDTERLKALAKKLAAEPLKFTLKTGPHGEVFSSVTKEDIAAALGKLGHADIKTDLEKPIRTVGMHHVVIHLGKGIEAKLLIEAVGDK